jgi:hypothetical protein
MKTMTKREQIGTVEILRDRVYPLNTGQDISDPRIPSVLVTPGDYPLYRELGEIYWEMQGHITKPRMETVDDGLFLVRQGHEPSDETATITSNRFGAKEWESFLVDPQVPSRLVFTLFAEDES